MTRIKVCGTTNRRDAELAVELGVDCLGFIFTRSKRQISVKQGKSLTAELPTSVERVGVFIDEPAALIGQAVEQCGLTAVQIYRPITDDDRQLGVTLFPALRVAPGQPIAEDGFQATDHPLLDTYRPDTDGGGTGRAWDWALAAQFARRYPILVSGGLSAENVAQAIRQLQPWGVDVCSGVEAEPGRKDPDKLRAFVAAVREVDRS